MYILLDRKSKKVIQKGLRKVTEIKVLKKEMKLKKSTQKTKLTENSTKKSNELKK